MRYVVLVVENSCHKRYMELFIKKRKVKIQNLVLQETSSPFDKKIWDRNLQYS